MPEKPKIDFNKLEEYSNDSWYVLTPENTEFGPFAWKDLLVFAGQHRVTILHKLKHPTKTKGKWIEVSAFSELVARIPAPVSATSSPPDHPTMGGIDLSKLNRRSQLSTSDQSVFLDVLLGLVDFQFKHYVTPSIIRFTWVVFLILVFSTTCLSIFAVLVASGVQVAASDEPKQVPQAQARQVQIQPAKPNAPSLATKIIESGYLSVISIVVQCTFSFLAVLWMRVIMECIIVVFDISNNIKSLANRQQV